MGNSYDILNKNQTPVFKGFVLVKRYFAARIVLTYNLFMLKSFSKKYYWIYDTFDNNYEIENNVELHSRREINSWAHHPFDSWAHELTNVPIFQKNTYFPP